MQVFRKKPLLVNTSGDERTNYMQKRKGMQSVDSVFEIRHNTAKTTKSTGIPQECTYVCSFQFQFDVTTTKQRATTLLTHNRYNVRCNRKSHSPRIGPYDPGSVSRKNHHFLVTAWFVVVAVAVRFGRVSYCDSSRPSRWYYGQSWCGGGCRYWSCRVCNCPQ